MSQMTKRDINLFLGALIISLVGNVCADYALMWYGLSLLSSNSTSATSHALTYFYVGQAVGVIVISPLLAVVFDRFTKLASSIALDLIYAALLLVMAILFHGHFLTPALVFIFSMLTAGLAILHKSSVGFAAVQKMSDVTGVTDIVSRFIAALSIPFLIGSVLSGVAFQYVGFVGCMIIGIVTFLPMPFIYRRLFGEETKIPTASQTHFIQDLKEGISVLRRDRLLSGTALSIAVLNIASAVLPAVVGFAFLKAYPGHTDYASIAISLAILAGVLATKKIGEMAKTWPIYTVVPWSILPASLALLLCLWVPSPYAVALMFLLSCLGSAARNVSSGSLRVARVPKVLIGRVNTVYSSLLYIGQTIGGFVVIKAVQDDFATAIWTILVCFALASLLSYRLLPREKVTAFLETAS